MVVLSGIHNKMQDVDANPSSLMMKSRLSVDIADVALSSFGMVFQNTRLTFQLILLFLAAFYCLIGADTSRANLPSPTPVSASAGGGWNWDGLGTTMYSTPQEACLRQFQKYAPRGTNFPPTRVSDTTYKCKWTGSLINPGWVRFNCRAGYTYYAPGQCLLPDKRMTEQCCEEGELREVNAPKSPSTSHPVSIGTGTKTWAEEDYTSEDGLLTVRRNYRSRLRGGERLSLQEPERFGAHWQGTIPGPLVFGATVDSEVEYLTDFGGIFAFVSTTDPANTTFTANTAKGSEHRLKLEIVAQIPEGMGRKDFIESAPVSAAGTGEFRVGMPNGDYVIYRRPQVVATGAGVRTAVPIEHGKASGYKQYFDYEGDSPVPYRLRDSFGREIGFEWELTNDIPSRLGGSERAIKKLSLPDGTTLEYDYDDGLGRPSPLGLASSSYSGAGGSGGGGTIIWSTSTIAYSKTRLRAVKRKAAGGTTLWSRKYLYENAYFPFALTGIEDHAERRLTTYTYDSIGDVASTESAGGADRHEFSRSYPSATRMLRTVKGPLGHVATYEYEIPATIKRYSTAKLLTIKGSINGSVEADQLTYSYSGNRIASLTDRRGTVTAYVNDANLGRPTQITDASGNVAEQQTGITWHPNWDLPVSEQQDGLRIDNVYDAQGRLTSSTALDTTTHSLPYATAGQTRTTNYSWTAQGKLASINGPLGPDAQGRDDVTSFAYDAGGNLLSVTSALGHITSFAGHDANGRAATMTDPNGVVTAFGYDGLGRMASVAVKHPATPALDAVTTLEYDSEGRIIGITQPQTAKLIVDYSVTGRVLASRSLDGERIDFTYDRQGNVVSQTVKRSNGSVTQSMQQSFDALGRLLSTTLGVGRPQRFQYDKEGNVTTLTDPRDLTSTLGLDALGRLISSTHPDGGVEASTYNKRDEAVSFTDAIDVTTTFVRNGFGEVIREVSPDRGTSTYYYDAAGRMTAEIDGRGQRIDYGYDIAGRLLSKTPVGRPASETVLYAYDGTGSGGGLGGYQTGRLTSVIDGSGLTRFGYDHRGNLIERQQVLGSTAAASLTYTYDLADRITGIGYPSGRTVRYGYDAKGRVGMVETRANPSAPWVTLASNMSYQPFGVVESMALGNGLAVANDRGLDGRLRARTLVNASSGATPIGTRLSDLGYGYDPGGNVTSIDDGVMPERSAIYGYDAMGRMNMMVADPGPGGGSTAASYSYTGGSNKLASLTTPQGTRSITYDNRGNPTSESRAGGQSVVLDYDGHGRLTGYARSGEVTLTHSYNGMDDRIATTMLSPSSATPDTRQFLYAPDGRVLGEYGSSVSDVRAEFIWMSPEVGANDNSPFGGDDGLGGYMPLAVAANDNGSGSGTPILAWVHANHMGVPALYTDSTGAQITPPTGYSAPGFPGQSRTLNDLYYNRYRDYDPSTGRYIQADPIGLAGGAEPYSYALNSPLRYTDPTGEFVPLLVVGGRLALQCALNPACRAGAVAGGAAILGLVYEWNRSNPLNPGRQFCPPALFRKSGDGGRYNGGIGSNYPGDETGDACRQEWEDAERICVATNMSRRITGGFDIQRCMKGLVSRRCGGNRPDYEHDPMKPKRLRPKGWNPNNE